MQASMTGSKDGRGLSVAVVVSRFNEDVTSRLLDGTRSALAAMGVAAADVRVVSVPGAVEIPAAALWLARGGRIDAVVALGAVIRGETSHYDVVCRMVADGCLRVMLDTGTPVAFGVLTCDDDAQALARSAADRTNKGYEAAEVAVEMANLRRMTGA